MACILPAIHTNRNKAFHIDPQAHILQTGSSINGPASHLAVCDNVCLLTAYIITDVAAAVSNATTAADSATCSSARPRQLPQELSALSPSPPHSYRRLQCKVELATINPNACPIIIDSHAGCDENPRNELLQKRFGINSAKCFLRFLEYLICFGPARERNPLVVRRRALRKRKNEEHSGSAGCSEGGQVRLGQGVAGMGPMGPDGVDKAE